MADITGSLADTAEPPGLRELRTFRNVLGQYPTGVAIVTARTCDGSAGDIGMTISSFNAVSLTPPLVLFCVDRRSLSLRAWQSARTYGISVLSEGQDALATRFATAGGDKWNGIPIERGTSKVALIKGAAAHLECLPYNQYDGGDHVMFVARVERYAVMLRPGPLVFCQGRYNYLKPGASAPPDWPLPMYY